VCTEAGISKTSGATETFALTNPGAGVANFSADGDVSGATLHGTGLTTGSVLFSGAAGLVSQDNANLFWDGTNNRLGVGTAIPLFDLTVKKASGVVYSNVWSAANAGTAVMYAAAGPGEEVEGAFQAWGTASAHPGEVRWRADGPGLTFSRFQTVLAAPQVFEYDDGISTREFARFSDGVGGVIFNNGALDRDFNIKGDTNANLFYVDASTDRVGIGDSTPAALFTVGSGDLFQVATTGDITMNGDLTFLPTTDNTGSIGSNANRFKLVRAVTITSGDLGFDDDECPICHKAIEEHDAVILTAKARVFPTEGKSYIPTVPAHLSCLVVDALMRAVGMGGIQ
jgi:hypothetical protein